MKLITVVASLRRARDEAKQEYDRLNTALAALDGNHRSGKRILSKEARERIAEAQRQRWALVRKQQKGKR